MKKILLLLLFPIIVFSQTLKEKNKIIDKTNVLALKNIAFRNDFEFKENKKKAQDFAKIKNWPLFTFKDSVYSELVGITIDLKPIYYSTWNNGAGITSRANKLHTGGSLGLNINGENMTAAVWDAGSGMPSHQLFSGRLQLMDNSPSTHYHSAHVAGTIIGSDLFQNGLAKGMAYKGNVNSYDWNSDISEVALAASNGLLISNHSYGRNPFIVDTHEWGKYDSAAQSYDEIMFNAPYYQFVCAAGNSRAYGVNTIKNGYDLLTGHATSKNGITVAAVNELQNYTGPSSVIMSKFSSWGATDDGRIKPDISAKGVDTFSAVDNSTSAYNTLSGTSMASPSVVGTLLLYQQYYKQLNNSFMKAATLRGLMIHTADEAGNSDGPDYKFGWGLLNAEKAANVITKNQLQSFILENTLNQSENFEISVNAIGDEPLIATLCWTDPKGAISGTTNDDPSPNLINNLDLRITKNSTTFLPWKLNGSNVSSPATNGDNNVDNVEKIEINNPSGSYTVSVSHKGTLLNNLQDYSLIISGITAKDFWITSTLNSKSVCEGTSSIAYNFNLHTKTDFNETVVFSTQNLPNGIIATFDPVNMNLAGEFTMNLTNMATLLPGTYPFLVKGETLTGSFETEVILKILSPTISLVELSEPSNNSTSVEIPVTFNWNLDPNAQQYDIQISSNSDFSAIIQESTVVDNTFTSSVLLHNSMYFWRVRAKNICNVGEFSNAYSFSTTCGLPTNIVLNSTTTTGAVISWTDTFSPSSWQIEVVPQGENPVGNGTIVTNTAFAFSNLNSNTCYSFYVRSNCGTGTSSWTEPLEFCTQPDYCAGDHFYDTGGPNGNYKNNEIYTRTISPDIVGNRVKAVFNYFDIENNWDYFTVYNGPDTNSPVLYSGTGTYIPNSLASTHSSGSLTFKFVSDEVITRGGWDATIICEPMPACPNTPTGSQLINSTYTSATFDWEENSNSTSWEIEIVPFGTSPTGSGVITSSKPYTATNLTSNSQYVFYIRSICSNGNSDWTNPLNFETKANYCAGDHFYDTGGPNGNYPLYDYKTTTIYPDNIGYRVKAIFNSFDLNNYASFMVFNGPTSNYPILFQSNGNNSPSEIKATNSQGALTIIFYANSNVTASGWDATIVCEPMPPCPNPPSNFYLVNSTTNSATISWNENSNASLWEIEVVPFGSTPTGIGITTGNNPYTKSGLNSNTWYDLYVRSKCSNGNSDWSLPYTFYTKANYCAGDHFYDTGGPNGNYQSNEYKTITIYPSIPSNRVKAVFNSFLLNNFDSFKIHNGIYSNSPILFSRDYNNPVSPETIEATNPQGALTFVFNSSSVSNEGWDATIICEPLPPCSNSPSYIYLNSTTTSSANFSWTENSNATSWEVEVVLQGQTPTGSGTIISSNPYTKSGLTSNTWYDFYIRSKCGSVNSTWTGPFKFNTKANYCAGDHFYDSGGPNGNYPSYEYKTFTIYPSATGNRVKAIFNLFELNNNDEFVIYNGTNTGAPLLFSRDYNNPIAPSTITATNQQGALTFMFDSSYQNNVGWDATIICEPLPPCSNSPSNINLNSTTTSSANFSWTENSNATSWEVEVVLQGQTPTGSGTIISSNPYTKSGLTSNTWYDFYIRSKCGSVNSTWTGPFKFNTKANYCAGDHFYDTGGPNGNYPTYEYKTFTIYPSATGNRVKAIFNLFELNNNDTFKVYNGSNSGAPLLFSRDYNNPISPSTITATNQQGALTFLFNSSYQNNVGWDATIICEPLPPCSNPPSNIYLNSTTTTSASFGWIENSNATSWEVEVVLQGQTPTGSGTIISSNPYTKSGLTSNTWYDFYVRSKCGSVNSTWTGPFKFNTVANYCDGDHFYDTAGPNGNYPSNDYQYITIYPTNTGDRVKAIFNLFSVNDYDTFNVYNGTHSGAPLLFSRDSNNPISPNTIAATNDQGALTFYFYGYSQSNIGWDATIICEPLPPCSNPPSNIYLNSTTTTSASFGWTENSNATSWEIEVVLQGEIPTGMGTIIPSNPYTKSGLTSNTWYDFYVRSKCGNVNSIWSGPFKFNTEANYCEGDHFYDTGGPNGNYPTYQYKTFTIYPSEYGDRVKAIFNLFELNNNDTFSVYNGINSGAPLLFSRNYNNPISPNIITATNQQGALTFLFNSSYQPNAGWDATIVCEPLPPCSNPPSNIYLNSTTTTSASFGWTENSNATSWEIEVVLQGENPTGNGTIVTNNPYTKTNLISNTWYNFYIRSKCGDVNSTWIGPFKFNTKANYCEGDHFYDTGGPNENYPAYEYKNTTIYPTPGNRVKAVFNLFELNDYDSFSVYDGINSSAPLLFSRNGSNPITPSTITATNLLGALTFIFNSSSQTNTGWDATIICEPIPGCQYSPNNVIINAITNDNAVINWTEYTSTNSWEIEIVPNGTLPIGSGVVVSTNPYTIYDLTSNSCYDVYVRSLCPDSNSSWSTVQTFCTTANYCGGDHFYDTGGPNGNYQNNENYTTVIYPDDPNEKVSATFNIFQLQLGNDLMRIYNGPSSSSPQISVQTGTNSPGTVTSTHPTGALTFYFYSNGTINNIGWDATINCSSLGLTKNETYNMIHYYPNPVTNILNIKSKKPISNYQIFDINMRNISSEKIDMSEFEIELMRFSSGVYFIKLYDNDGNSKEIKVIKE